MSNTKIQILLLLFFFGMTTIIYFSSAFYPSYPLYVLNEESLFEENMLINKTFRNFNVSTPKTDSNESFSIMTEEQLRNDLYENCTKPIKANAVILVDEELMSLANYKKYLAHNFTKTYANPVKKRGKIPSLKSYDKMKRPDPKKRIKNLNLTVDEQVIKEQMETEKARRMKLGDDDILKIPEVQAELQQTEYEVPNLLHYIWFGCDHRFRVDHYITILGGLKYQNPRLILFHTNCEPSGEYWDTLKMQSGNKLKIVQRNPPKEIWGLKIQGIEHKADIARLQIMLEVGGIYLDTDSVVLRSLDELRKNKLVLGESNFDSLANGIIFANRTSWFLQRWYLEYKHFVDSVWGFNSVLVPWALWKIYPTRIHVVKELICRPNWQELEYIFHEIYDWHHNYILHLYSRYMKAKDGMGERPLKQLAVLNTTYGQIARYVIWGDDKIRDVTEWIVTCNVTEALIS